MTKNEKEGIKRTKKNETFWLNCSHMFISMIHKHLKRERERERENEWMNEL